MSLRDWITSFPGIRSQRKPHYRVIHGVPEESRSRITYEPQIAPETASGPARKFIDILMNLDREEILSTMSKGWSIPHALRHHAEAACLLGMQDHANWAWDLFKDQPPTAFISNPAPLMSDINIDWCRALWSLVELDRLHPPLSRERVEATLETWNFEAAVLARKGMIQEAREVAAKERNAFCDDEFWFVECIAAWLDPLAYFEELQGLDAHKRHTVGIPTAIVELGTLGEWEKVQTLFETLIVSDFGPEKRRCTVIGLSGRLPWDMYPMM